MNITVVNLNPCIDWQLTVDSFVYGGLNRVTPGKKYVAGKGINVCLALASLGQPSQCLGFNYRENGSFITDALDEQGIPHDFIVVEGAVRTNIKLYDNATGAMTELNQPGAQVSGANLLSFHEKISALGNSMLVFSGSLPMGVPVDTYRQICDMWHGKVILDAEGEALRLALEGDKPPFCIKPNLYELTSSFGVKLSSKEEIAAFCKELIRRYGLKMICVSMGADGAVLVTAASAFFIPALELPVNGVQGAGDALVAGLVYGLSLGASESEMLRMAAAAAAASVIREGTLMCTREGYAKFLAEMPEPIRF